MNPKMYKPPRLYDYIGYVFGERSVHTYTLY